MRRRNYYGFSTCVPPFECHDRKAARFAYKPACGICPIQSPCGQSIEMQIQDITIQLTIAALCSFQPVLSEDYCQSTLCESDVKHTACGTDGQFVDDCASVAAVQVDLQAGGLQESLLRLHNEHRNTLAAGKLANFVSASRMRQIVRNTSGNILLVSYCEFCIIHSTSQYWDADLAYVAGFVARKCRMQHDRCRSTVKYPQSGQNLGQTSASGAYTDDTAAINEMVSLWFDEYRNANMDVMRSFRPTSDANAEYGHFTQLMQQRSGRIGCAMVRYPSTDGQWFNSLLACNYSFENFIGEAVYEEGVAASNCSSSVSELYGALCVNE